MGEGGKAEIEKSSSKEKKKNIASKNLGPTFASYSTLCAIVFQMKHS